jgi:hypothetical protein
MNSYARSTHFEEAREAMSDKNRRDHRQEKGFALILAILALMLLTFLGLTLATTTSTELRIATNYRWNAQAVYNAEAGIEAGKRILQTLNWARILPQTRTAGWDPTTLTLPVAAPGSTTYPLTGLQGTRNWEMGNCDKLGGGAGYGAILHDEAGTPNVYENVTIVPSFVSPPALNGAFTLWVRRPVMRDTAVAGQYKDDNDLGQDDIMILTAEGVAPYSGGALQGASARSNLARRIIEVSVRRQSQPAPCAARSGQIGGGPEGNNVFGSLCGDFALDQAAAGLSFATGNKGLLTP